MSVAATKWVWEQTLAPSEKLVLLCVADYAWKDGSNAFPGIATIAESTGLSERQVQRYIKGFVTSGILAVDEHQSGGRGLHPVYRFTALKGDTDDTLSEQKRATPVTPIPNKRVTSETQKGDAHDNKRVTPTVVKGDMGGGLYIEEPNEPSTEPLGEPSLAKPLPENGPAQCVVKAFCAAVGIDKPGNYRKAVGQAQQLVNAGLTPEQVPEIVGWLFADSFWADKGIDLGIVLNQFDKWRAVRNAPKQPVTFKPGQRMSGADIMARLASLERQERSS